MFAWVYKFMRSWACSMNDKVHVGWKKGQQRNRAVSRQGLPAYEARQAPDAVLPRIVKLGRLIPGALLWPVGRGPHSTTTHQQQTTLSTYTWVSRRRLPLLPLIFALEVNSIVTVLPQLLRQYIIYLHRRDPKTTPELLCAVDGR